jgi:hypothetical protein
MTKVDRLPLTFYMKGLLQGDQRFDGFPGDEGHAHLWPSAPPPGDAMKNDEQPALDAA